MAYGKKSGFSKAKESVSNAFRKAVMVTLAAGTFIGAPGWYYYGSVEEKEVKVTSVESMNWRWDDRKNESAYDYRVLTSGGTYQNSDTYTHLKFDSKELQEQLKQGQTYRIKSYGYRFSIPFGYDLRPNIINATLVTEEEIKERQRAKETALQQDARKAAQAQQSAADPAAGTAGTTAASGAQPQALSGNMVTIEMISDGQRIQMTLPVEVIGKVTVNKVSPLNPPAPAPAVPKPPGQ